MIYRFLLLMLLCGCGAASGNLQSRHSSDVAARGIRRIAVLPPTAVAGQKAAIPFTAPVGVPRATEREAPEILARQLYLSLASLGQWQIVSESEVREVDTASLGGEAARMQRVGEMAYADAVLTGTVLRFRERVGEEWGAKSPASVAFTLELVDVCRGDVVWSARFDETQKSLSENLMGVFQIGERGLRWLSAEELSSEGVKQATGQLHRLLVKNPN